MKKPFQVQVVIEKATGNEIRIKAHRFNPALHERVKPETKDAGNAPAPKPVPTPKPSAKAKPAAKPKPAVKKAAPKTEKKPEAKKEEAEVKKEPEQTTDQNGTDGETE
jgi:hypothetical protein